MHRMTWSRLGALLCAGLLAAGCGLVDLEGIAAGQQPADAVSATGGASGGPGAGDSGGCADVLLLAARGTGEPGTLGVVVGDPLRRALHERVGSASAAPVDYPAATITLNGILRGAENVVDELTRQAEACPDQQFALAGYSQGAMVILTSLNDLPPDLADRVAAVVLFGNPLRARGTGEFVDRTMDICATGDEICHGGPGNGTGFGHLSYTSDVDRAAQFIAEHIDG
jgi:cutinase